MNYNAIGARIRAFRKAKGLSQEQLAEKVWISTTHMSHIETGSTKLSLPVLIDLATALDVGTDDILQIHQYTEKISSQQSIQQLLHSCSAKQLKVLEEILKTAKTAMDTHL